MNLPWSQLSWVGTACVLIVGPSVIVGLTAGAARLTRSAAWQRTLWQVALLGILLLTAVEISGTSAAVIGWLRLNGLRPAASVLPDEAAPLDLSAQFAQSAPSEPSGLFDPSDSIAVPGDLRPHQDGSSFFAVAWLLGTVGLLLRLVWGRCRLGYFCRHQTSAAEPAMQQRVRRLAARLGMVRTVRVLQTFRVASPFACGWRRPVIVIPATLRDEFAAAEVDAMLAHELAHLAAGDIAWQLLADVTVAGLWWHPLVWRARHLGREAGEMAADEACRIIPQGRDLLAGCLVRLARRLESCPGLSSLAMADPVFRSMLGRRVDRLLSLPAEIEPDVHRTRRRFVLATFPAIWLALAVFCTSWAHAQVPSARGVTTMKMLVWSWRQSLAAAALAAVLSPAASDAAEGQPEVPAAKAEREGDRGEAKREREADRPEAREGREGDRPAIRREGEREGDRPAIRREGDGERRPAPSPERMEQRRQLEEKAAGLRRRLESLRPDQDSEARELRAGLARIEAELREGPPPPREVGERAERMRHLEELKAAMNRAREAGNREEVERLERESREVLRHLGDRPGERPRPEGEAGEIQRRMQHLRVAIENLRAAGLNAQADAMAGEAERWMRERGMPPEARERPAMPPVPAQMERAMHEMREQMQELRRQMEEMRRQLHQLGEKERR